MHWHPPPLLWRDLDVLALALEVCARCPRQTVCHLGMAVEVEVVWKRRQSDLLEAAARLSPALEAAVCSTFL